MQALGRILSYALRQKRGLAGILALSAASAAATAVQPWPLKLLLDHALGAETPPAWLAGLLPGASAATWVAAAALASLLVFAVNTTLQSLLTWRWTTVGEGLVRTLAEDLYGALLGRSLPLHHRQPVGDALARLSEDTYCVYRVTEGLLVSPVLNVLTLLSVGAVAWSLDPGLTAITLAAAPLMAVSAMFFGGLVRRRARASREARSRITSLVHRTLAVIPVVQVFGAGRRHRQEFDALAEHAVVVSRRSALAEGVYDLMGGLIAALGAAAVLLVGGGKAIDGTLTVGGLVVFMAYLASLQAAFRGLLVTWRGLKSAEADAERVLEAMDLSTGVSDRPDARPLPPAASGGVAVRLEDVTFGYEPGRPVLEHVSLDVRPGETVALVGTTGAGKSTLASLLPRLVDSWSGRILVDGHDLREVTLASLRARIALVPQEPLLLPLTVAENVAYGRPGATREEVVAAATNAGADGFVRALPRGYDTPLAELGATLSGGQRQRLSIARAFLKDAPLLVLDEPTSALDAATEGRLVETLARLSRGRTTLVIAHRLSTIRGADRIVVLEHGRVVEVGTHAELLAAGGRYRTLHDLQAKGLDPGEAP